MIVSQGALGDPPECVLVRDCQPAQLSSLKILDDARIFVAPATFETSKGEIVLCQATTLVI